MANLIEGFLGKNVNGTKSRIPAKLDYLQSATGLILALFMWAHLALVSSILISADFMNKIAKFFEGSLFLSEPNPFLVTMSAFAVFVIFMTHAVLAMRKFPINFRQWQIYRTHMTMMKHPDTSMWYTQAATGCIMFFLGSAHIYMMMTQAATISAEGAGYRMFSQYMWPFYLILLFAVELHATIGLYRLCVKWGWFEGSDAKATRANLKKVKTFLTAFFLILGVLSLIAYVKIGYEQKDSFSNPHGKSHAGITIQYDMNKKA